VSVLQSLAYLSVLLLADAFVAAFTAAYPCQCGCGSTTQQHSPLRRAR